MAVQLTNSQEQNKVICLIAIYVGIIKPVVNKITILFIKAFQTRKFSLYNKLIIKTWQRKDSYY